MLVGMKQPPVVVGIDPGNESAGVCLWAPTLPLPEGGHAYEPVVSWTMSPWQATFVAPTWMQEPSIDLRHVAYVEVPQNGTHKSRGGVHWAAGMIVGRLLPAMGLRRGDVTKVTPSRWRRAVFRKTPDDYKAEAVALCRLLGLEPRSVDEAEAVCIGLAGVLLSGGQVSGKVKKATEDLR